MINCKRRTEIYSYIIILLICCVSCSRSQDGNHLEGFTPLTKAIVLHDYQSVKKLLESGANPNDTTELGATPLWLAAGNNDTEVLLLLIAYNANVNESPRKNGGQSLAEVVVSINAINSLKILYAHGLSIQAKNRNGESLLNAAAERNNLETAAFLLKHGLDPNNRDSLVRNTPINDAVNIGSPAMVSLLLSNGADPNSKGLANFTPLIEIVLRDAEKEEMGQATEQLRMFGDSSYLSRHKRCVEIITTLLHSGASPNLPDKHGFTPLHYAARYCDSTMAIILLQNGADRDAKDEGGKTALDLAEKRGCTSVEALLKQ